MNAENEEEPMSGRQHDNYINFDIAQIIVKESKSDAPSPKSSGEGVVMGVATR